jgi:hypothetical protein
MVFFILYIIVINNSCAYYIISLHKIFKNYKDRLK